MGSGQSVPEAKGSPKGKFDGKRKLGKSGKSEGKGKSGVSLSTNSADEGSTGKGKGQAKSTAETEDAMGPSGSFDHSRNGSRFS